MNTNNIDALRLVKLLRADDIRGCSRILSCLENKINEKGLSVEDIGIKEGELEEFRVKCSMYRALDLLALIRGGNGQYELLLFELREEVKKGGFSLVYIGTSEEELTSFT